MRACSAKKCAIEPGAKVDYTGAKAFVAALDAHGRARLQRSRRKTTHRVVVVFRKTKQPRTCSFANVVNNMLSHQDKAGVICKDDVTGNQSHCGITHNQPY